MSELVTDLDPPSPGDLPGSREARPLPVGPIPTPAGEIQPASRYPGEARARPAWARRGRTQPVTGYPGEASSWPVLDHPGDTPPRPVLPRHAEVRPMSTRRRSSGRPVRLLTLERDHQSQPPPPPQPPPRAARRSRSAAGRRSESASAQDWSRGGGLRDWMAALLRDRSTLQLDTSNICMVLHALWKKPARREPMLRDPEFRQKAFNAFIMDVLK